MKLSASKIRQAIFEKGKTQLDLSKASGVCSKTINSICRGHSCRATTAAKIAEALEIPLDDLIVKE